MKNLKSLKKFKAVGLELNKSQQLKIEGGLYLAEDTLGDTVRMSPTNNNTQCGDCDRLAKRDYMMYDDPNLSYNRTRLVGVDAQDCHL